MVAISSGDRTPYVVVRAGERACALAVAHVVETLRPLPVEPLGAMPPFVLGLAVIRGAPVPVVDLGALLGGAALAAPARFVTLRAGARTVALAVDAVVGVRALDAAALAALAPLLREAGGGVVERIGALDAQLLVVLRAARLLSDEAWRALAREPAP